MKKAFLIPVSRSEWACSSFWVVLGTFVCLLSQITAMTRFWNIPFNRLHLSFYLPIPCIQLSPCIYVRFVPGLPKEVHPYKMVTFLHIAYTKPSKCFKFNINYVQLIKGEYYIISIALHWLGNNKKGQKSIYGK